MSLWAFIRGICSYAISTKISCSNTKDYYESYARLCVLINQEDAEIVEIICAFFERILNKCLASTLNSLTAEFLKWNLPVDNLD